VSGLEYYGSTSKSIEIRLQEHQHDYKRYVDGKKNYITSFDIIKNGNYKIELMEECNDENRKERESYYIRNLECVNKYIPDRTKEEYDKEYNENNKEQRNEYYENNKEKILQKHKEYYKKIKEHKEEKAKVKYTCECGSTIRKDSKSKHEKTITHQSFINTR
jgi:hypothetical protein